MPENGELNQFSLHTTQTFFKLLELKNLTHCHLIFRNQRTTTQTPNSAQRLWKGKLIFLLDENNVFFLILLEEKGLKFKHRISPASALELWEESHLVAWLS